MEEGLPPETPDSAPGEVDRAVRLRNAGPILDPEAKAAYRRRLEELEAEIAEAEAWRDGERAERAREEKEFLVQALAGAVGLGGRDRLAASAAERARINVTRAIKAALARIQEHSPALGRHLARTVRTGIYCSYAPDPASPAPGSSDPGTRLPRRESFPFLWPFAGLLSSRDRSIRLNIRSVRSHALVAKTRGGSTTRSPGPRPRVNTRGWHGARCREPPALAARPPLAPGWPGLLAFWWR